MRQPVPSAAAPGLRGCRPALASALHLQTGVVELDLGWAVRRSASNLAFATNLLCHPGQVKECESCQLTGASEDKGY